VTINLEGRESDVILLRINAVKARGGVDGSVALQASYHATKEILVVNKGNQ